MFSRFGIIFTAFLIPMQCFSQSIGFENEWLIGIGEIIEASYSPDGNYLAVVSNNDVSLYDPNSFEKLSLLKRHNRFDILKWSPNSEEIFVAETKKIERTDNVIGYNTVSDNSTIINIKNNDQRKLNINIFIGGSLPTSDLRNIQFSLDGNTLAYLDENINFSIINLENLVVTNPFFIQFKDNNFRFNFTTDNDYLTLFSAMPTETGNNLKILYLDKDTLELKKESLYEDSFSGYDITNDSRFILRKTQSVAIITIVNSFWAYDYTINKRISLGSVSLTAGEPVPIVYLRYLYFSNLNKFCTALTGGFRWTQIKIRDSETGNIESEKDLKIVSKFTQPFSSDGKLFLAGDHFPIQEGNNSIGSMVPSYDLYKFDWNNLKYEHILPKSSPKMIAFTNSGDSSFLTHTNRITKQFYRILPGLNEELLENIPNKYSQPKTEIWNPNDQTLVSDLQNKPFYDLGVFSNDNAMFASPVEPISATQTQINLYDTNSWEIAHELPVNATNEISSITFSPDNQLFLATHKAMDIWNANTGEKIQTITNHDGKVFYANFSTDSKRILSTGSDGKLIEYNLATNNSNTLIQESSPVIFADYIEDETQIIYTLNDGISKVLNLSNNNIIQTIPATLADNSFRAVKLSADERFLIVGNQIWNIATAELVNTIAEHAELMEDLQVSSDGKWVASRHSDFTARVWSTTEIYQQETAVDQFARY